MRNAVIRKKRLKAERIVDDFMRMPRRLMVGAYDFDPKKWTQTFAANRLGIFGSD